jgi:ribosomal protein S6--L-glutamate ligase
VNTVEHKMAAAVRVFGEETVVNDSAMRLCFIVEDRYRNDGMPLEVARELSRRGHDIELLEPQRSVTAISEVLEEGARFDAYVLKTVSDGPGLSILEAVSAAGHVTINAARSVRLARDKAVAAAVARSRGLPVPLTYFAATRDLVHLVPAEMYPIVVKPANGSSCECIYLVNSPADLGRLDELGNDRRFFLVQPYAPNPGVDVKLYCMDGEVFVTHQRSPLHPSGCREPSLRPLTDELEHLAREVGSVFGLGLYGVDVVETDNGWLVLDVNDFPSFSFVPNAAKRVADAVIRLAQQGYEPASLRPTPTNIANIAPRQNTVNKRTGIKRTTNTVNTANTASKHPEFIDLAAIESEYERVNGALTKTGVA